MVDVAGLRALPNSYVLGALIWSCSTASTPGGEPTPQPEGLKQTSSISASRLDVRDELPGRRSIQIAELADRRPVLGRAGRRRSTSACSADVTAPVGFFEDRLQPAVMKPGVQLWGSAGTTRLEALYLARAMRPRLVVLATRWRTGVVPAHHMQL